MHIRVNASILHLLICYTLVYHLCHITPRHSSLLLSGLLLWYWLLVLHLRLSHLHLLYWLLPLLLHTIPYTCGNCLNLLHYRLWLLPLLLWHWLLLYRLLMVVMPTSTVLTVLVLYLVTTIHHLS